VLLRVARGGGVHFRHTVRQRPVEVAVSGGSFSGDQLVVPAMHVAAFAMEKVLLMSVIVVMVVLPLRAGHDVSPRRGLKRALVGVLGYNVIYALLLRFVLPRLG
jgi:hypothetical protein